MVHLSGYSTTLLRQTPPLQPVASGKLKTVQFGMQESETARLEHKQDASPQNAPVEPSLLKRMTNRVIQFFKDIWNAFGHLFSWRSPKNELQRSGEEFLDRHEVRTVLNWLAIKDVPKGEQPHFTEEDPDPRTETGRTSFVKTMVNSLVTGYETWEKTQKQPDGADTHD